MSESEIIVGEIRKLGTVRYGRDERKVGEIFPKNTSETEKCEKCQTYLQAVTVVLFSAIADTSVGTPVDIWWCPKCKVQR